MLSYLILLRRHHEVHLVKKPGKDKRETATIGLLTVYRGVESVFHCITVENGGPSTNKQNTDRRIMPGPYKIKLSPTGVSLPAGITEGYLLYRDDDPTFERRRIFIHVGNYPQDTEGCILLNSEYSFLDHPGYAKGSTTAVKRFYDIMRDADLTKATMWVKEIDYGEALHYN